MVGRFNQTLKTVLQKHLDLNGINTYLSGILHAYRETLHMTPQAKSLHTFCLAQTVKPPTDAALLKPSSLQPGDTQNYREGLSISLSSSREIAAKAIHKAQQHYKTSYDWKLKPITYVSRQ